jgi:hypothetical protein
MMTPRWLCTVILLASAACSSAADESPTPAPKIEIRGPNVRPGYPDAFALGYKLAEDSVSPDGRYGVIYCNDPDIVMEGQRNFLVALKPFRILAVVDEFSYRDRTELKTEWTKDSSAALVEVAGKWGPIGFTLFELRDGRITRQTNLYAQIERLLEPGFRRAKVERYNDVRHFILDSAGGDQRQESGIDADGKRIHFDVDGTSNPKPMEPPIKTWRGRLEAVWSIPEARWVTQKVTNSTYRQ